MAESVKLKVMEAQQEEAYKGIVRIDSETMHRIGVRPGEIVEIEGGRKTVGIVDRAYPADIGQSVIRMDGIIRRNAKTGIGELVIISKAEVQPAKTVTIAPSQEGLMIQADPNYFKHGLLGRAVVLGDFISLGGTRRRRKSFEGSPFEDIFEDVFERGFLGFGSLKFMVTETSPKKPVIITEATVVSLSPHAVKISEEQKAMEYTYEDIGGLEDEVKKVREMIELPLKHPEIFEKLGIEPPKGVLLHGPPGCGKTLLAKAVANESDTHFISINSPEIMSKFVGEAEKKIRELFEDAEKKAPSIIFIDEIDAISPKREESYGEVERRVVAQLLGSMDGLKSRGRVVVIAATNRPNAIDPALRRPGRFDREIEIGVPSKPGRLNILKIHTRNMPLKGSIYLDYFSELLIEEIKLKIVQNKNEIIDFENKNINNKRQIELFKKQIEEDKRQIEVLNIQKEEIKSKIFDLENKLNEGDSNTIEKIKSYLMKYKKQLIDMNENYENIEKGIKDKNNKLTEKHFEIEQISKNIQDNSDNIDELNKINISLESDHKKLEMIYYVALDLQLKDSFWESKDAPSTLKIITNRKKDILPEILNLYDKLERNNILSTSFKKKVEDKGILRDLESIADITHGFVGADISALCKEAAMTVLRRILPDLNMKEESAISSDILDKLIINKTDFIEALKMVYPSAMREVLIEIPNVKWENIGGLKEIKQKLTESVEWPLKRAAEYKRMGIKPPKGILMYGPPGCGKTMLAKAVANESEANFILIKGPELINQFVGESERGIRKVFEKARQVAPTIIFFDEIDSIAPRRGRGSETGSNVTDRMINQLLTEMDGLVELNDVIIIGATNRPDIIDPALMRPGRFDRVLLVSVPDREARLDILKIFTKHMPLAKNVNCGQLADLTENYVGADIENLCKEAAIIALRESFDIKEVTMKHFKQALEHVKSYITKEYLDKYQNVEEELKTARGVNPKRDNEMNYLG